jgi:hypothetical protein
VNRRRSTFRKASSSPSTCGRRHIAQINDHMGVKVGTLLISPGRAHSPRPSRTAGRRSAAVSRADKSSLIPFRSYPHDQQGYRVRIIIPLCDMRQQ